MSPSLKKGIRWAISAAILVFLVLFARTIDWHAGMKLLRSAPGQYPLLLELREVPDLGQPLDAANRAFDALEKMGRE